MKSWVKFLIVAAIVVVALLFLWRVDVVAYWKTSAGDKNFGVDITGKTEVIGKDGRVISLTVAQKVSMLPLSFYYQNTEVTALKVTLSWTASGQDVDWTTLTLTISATGTGGYSSSTTSTQQSGSAVFTLPITTTQLGYTPSSGQQITWQMTINIQGSVKSVVGQILTAQAQPITCQVTTVWYSPSFSISSSATTTTDSGTSSGGCGPPGQHVVWVYNVQPEGISKYQDIFPLIGVTIYAAIAATTIHYIKKAKRALTKRWLNDGEN